MASISDELNGLLSWKRLKKMDLAQYMGFTFTQSLTNKFLRESWSVADLIKVVNFLQGELIIRVDGREVKLTEAHIASKSAKSAESTD